jgi:ATP/maltotriose-dependent transcriptional regulator MalT
MERGYDDATDDGPRQGVGCRLALAYAVAGRGDDARRVLEDLRTRSGGTYSDRLIALWAESIVHAQGDTGEALAIVDAAHAMATATDARLEHAIAALARAKVFGALGAPDAIELAEDARRQFAGLGLTGDGWIEVFDAALADVHARAASE